MKFVFLGGQGSGKSTQAKLMSNKLDLPHYEMGHILRESAAEENELGRKIKSALDTGHLVDNKITIKVLAEKIANNPASKGYILDGYPRDSTQLAALEPDITKVFYIKVADDEAIKRLTKRGRSDDKESSISKRLEIYHDLTEPLLSTFREKKILVEIDGERSIEEIHDDIMAIVRQLPQ